MAHPCFTITQCAYQQIDCMFKYLLFSLMIASACMLSERVTFAAGCGNTYSAHEIALCGNDQRYEIPKKDIPTFISKALDGDSHAAARLAWYYGQIKWDKYKSRFWFRIAAENGDPVSMYNLAIIYDGLDSPNEHERAHFWAAKAAADGHDPELTKAAKTLLEEMAHENAKHK